MRRTLDYVKKEEKTEAIQSLIFELERFEEMSRVEELIEQNSQNGEKIFAYISNPVKTQLVSGVNCTPETAHEEMLIVKRMYNKLSGRQFIHFVQSFSPEENLTPEIAHEVGLKLAQFEGFKGFQIVMATHTDAHHLHNHFVINSVNSETGLKWQQSSHGLKKVKEYSDKICQEYGLSVIPWKNQDRKPPGEYRAHERGDSWKHELRLAVKECLRNSISRADFVANMARLGYKVKWTDSRKYITFTTPEGMMCRNIKLGQEFAKDKMLKEFEINKRHSNHQELQKAMDSLAHVVDSPAQRKINNTGSGQPYYIWKDKLRLVARECLRNSMSRPDFVANMARLGYKVKWTDTRKYVTFTTPEGMRCRNIKLGQEFDKDKMLKELELNSRNCNPQDLKDSMESLVKVLKSSESDDGFINDKNIWRHELRLAVKESLRNSITREEFFANMSRLGYQVSWENKNLFFINPKGNKCCSDHLGKWYVKENLFKMIETNKEYFDRRRSQARIDLFLEFLNFLAHRNHGSHSNRHPLSKALEGQALKDKIIEEQLGSGLDWDKGEGYEHM